MIQNNQVQAIDEYNMQELMQNGELRYVQLTQVSLPNDLLVEIDYDLMMHQATLIEHHGDQRMYYRVAHEVRAKELIWNFYGIRYFRLANIWRKRPRQQGDPHLMDLTFPEMRDRYELLQFDVVRIPRP